uniref:SUN domain-containing protein n=1 Tax=Ditylenchus dipsaci TaxID=166011 RepID=A0A915DY93_9BILA
MFQISKRFLSILVLASFLLSLQYIKVAYSEASTETPGGTAAADNNVSVDDHSTAEQEKQWVVQQATPIESNTPSTNSGFNLPNAAVFKENVVESHLEPSQFVKPTNGINDEPLESPRRNYASKECGAKVIFANDEAENKNAVLNDKERDDYMRNPCDRAQNKFLIVELCENIQPTMLEIANFELFSSSPKEIRFSISERYPTLEWQVVGEFEAQDNREFQSFPTLPTGAYAKFIKLELVSHHGREHYCTLSCLRVYGTSMVDEYEAEAAGIETPVIIPPIQLPIPALEQDFQWSLPIKKPSLTLPCYQCPSTQTNTSLWLCHLLNVGYSNVVSQHIKQSNRSVKSNSSRVKPYRQNVNMTGVGTEVCSLKDNLFSNTSEAKLDGKFSTPNDDNPKDPVIIEAPKAINPPPTAQIPAATAPSIAPAGEVLSAPSITPVPVVIPLNNAPILQQQQQANNNQPKAVFNKANDRVVQNPLPGTSSSHKESVFMKMNKRLSAIESNMSLGNDMLITTLAEINRRHEAQKEEFVKQHERVLKGSQEHAARNSRAIQNIQNEILVMKQDTTNMRSTLVKLEEKSEGWRRTANKFRLENRRLKQDIKDLREVVDQLNRDFRHMANDRKESQPIYLP